MRGLNQRICRKFAGPAWPAHRGGGVATPKSRFQVGKRQKRHHQGLSLRTFRKKLQGQVCDNCAMAGLPLPTPTTIKLPEFPCRATHPGWRCGGGSGGGGRGGLWQRICHKLAGFTNRPSAWPVLARPLGWRREGVGWVEEGGRSVAANLPQIRSNSEFAANSLQTESSLTLHCGVDEGVGVGWVEEGRQKPVSSASLARLGMAGRACALPCKLKRCLPQFATRKQTFMQGYQIMIWQKTRRETNVKSTEFAANSLDFPFRASQHGQGLPHPGPKINRICCKFVGFAFSPPACSPNVQMYV